MKLTATQDHSQRETMLLTDCFYSVEESGWGTDSMPILHCCGRSEDDSRRHVRIFGFRPRFYINEQEFVEQRGSIETQMRKRSGSIVDYSTVGHKLMDGRKTIDGVMIVCETPTDVPDLRENFSRTWEADVPFTEVFKTDNRISQYLSVPHGKQEVHHSQVRSEDDSEVDIDDRLLIFDIEVRSDDGFPDYESPTKEVTAITAHDSYEDEYWSGVLRHKGWGSEAENHLRQYDGPLTVYDSDKELLYSFVEYLQDVQPDLVSGWNSNGFDVPYFINRSLKLNVGGLEQLSPTNDVKWISDAPRNTNYGWKGVVCLDALSMYKAVTIGQEKSYKLDDIAQTVLGYGKDELDSGIDDAWENSPRDFLEYNVRDVEAVVQIIEEKDMIEDMRGRRELTGAQLDAADYPKNLIGPSFLRHARGYLE